MAQHTYRTVMTLYAAAGSNEVCTVIVIDPWDPSARSNYNFVFATLVPSSVGGNPSSADEKRNTYEIKKKKKRKYTSSSSSSSFPLRARRHGDTAEKSSYRSLGPAVTAPIDRRDLTM